MRNDYVVLSVQFHNDKQNQFTGKYYNYLLDKRLYFKHRDCFIKLPFTFEITSGYNYRGSKVRAMAARNVNSNESMDDFKIIQNFGFVPLMNRGVCNEDDFLTELQDSLFKLGVTGTTAATPVICNCDAAEAALSATTAADNNFYTDLSVNGITLGGGGGGYDTNFIYIPKHNTLSDGICSNSSDITITTGLSTVNLTETIDKIEKELETLKNNKDKKEKENINMNKFGLNIKFGKVPTSEIRMSMYGPAFESVDGWFANKDGEYINVDNFLFGEENYCYMLPATEDNLELGDYILHNGGWCRVINVDECGRLVVEKIFTHEVVTVLPTKNIFGYEFYTKLIPLFGDMFTVSKEQPFGNMLPLILMDNKENNKDMFMMMMAMQGGKMDMSNPFMMMALMGDKSGKNDMFEMMMLMQMMHPKHECNCHKQLKMEDM